MKFLADQDVYGVTVRFLMGLGHDVVPVAQLGLAQTDDFELLRVAHQEGRIFARGIAISGRWCSSRAGDPA